MAIGYYTNSILGLANEAITVTRRTATAPIDGKTQAPTTATFALDAVVQPADGDDLQRLPEGRIDAKVYVVWSLQELIAGGRPPIMADLVTYRGEIYEVEHVEPYLGFFGKDHWECIIRGVP